MGVDPAWARTHRGHDLSWQCLAIGDSLAHATMTYPHLCTLPAKHWGHHVCWCGWGFSLSSATCGKLELPEPSKE